MIKAKVKRQNAKIWRALFGFAFFLLTSAFADAETPLGTTSNPAVVRDGVSLTVKPGGSLVVENGATVTGLEPSSPTKRPDLVATGAGTEASPYTHADNTAGIQTSINALATGRGGVVKLVPSRYNTTTAITITSPSVKVIGDVSGFNVDPNGESEGVNGTKIRHTGTAFTLGSNSARIGGVVLQDIYFWGPSKGTTFGSGIAINIVNGLDQARFVDLNFANVTHPIYIGGASGWADDCYFDRINVLGATYGIVENGGLPSVYARVFRSTFADLERQGILLIASPLYWQIQGNALVRCARTHNDVADCAMYITGRGHNIVGNTITETGSNLNAGTWNSAADGIMMNAAYYCTVEGNTISSTQNGAGIRILSGQGNMIRGNKMDLNNIDIVINAGVLDTTIECDPRTTITDGGTRTVINGLGSNAGDPDTTGQWNGVTKAAGLKIYDTSGGILWEYGANFSGGRRKVASGGANTDITALTGLTTPLGAAYGGTGVANNAAATLTRSGNHALTLTTTGTTSLTLPTLGTLVGLVNPPASASSTGVAGQWAYDTGYVYVCTATNTWKRVAIATWVNE